MIELRVFDRKRDGCERAVVEHKTCSDGCLGTGILIREISLHDTESSSLFLRNARSNCLQVLSFPSGKIVETGHLLVQREKVQ